MRQSGIQDELQPNMLVVNIVTPKDSLQKHTLSMHQGSSDYSKPTDATKRYKPLFSLINKRFLCVDETTLDQGLLLQQLL